jgi:hypothetical protein
MTDEVLLFIYGLAVAGALIAVAAYYYMPTLAGATQAQAEYAALRGAAPILVLAQDGKVHMCINSTAPQRVLVQRLGIWTDAHRDCHIDPSGQCAEAGRGAFCRWYLGGYEVGDNVTVVLKTDHASVAKSYRIAAVAPSARLGAPNNAAGGQNTVGGQNGAQVVTVTLTGVVYRTTVATVTSTATYYSTTTTTVTAPAVTVTHTVIIQDPGFTETRMVRACPPGTTTTDTTATTPRFPPIEFGRYGFQPLPAATSTVARYTTVYTTSYVTSTATTTVWLTSTFTYTPTVTTTAVRLRPGVLVNCYICQTDRPGPRDQPDMTCSTTTLATTTSITTITGGSGFAQPNTNRGLDTFFLGLAAVAMIASSVMIAKKR